MLNSKPFTALVHQTLWPWTAQPAEQAAAQDWWRFIAGSGKHHNLIVHTNGIAAPGPWETGGWRRVCGLPML